MNSLHSTSPRCFWPHAIIGWFVIFASALAAWVSFAMRQDMDLVRADYYEEEVHFQNQLDRMNRTASLNNGITIEYDATQAEVSLQLPRDSGIRNTAGRIRFYRPSNAALDFEVPLEVDTNGLQRISVNSRPAGLWKIRIHWDVGAQDFFSEQTLVLGRPDVTAVAPAK